MNERIKELSEQAQLYARQGMGKCVIELKRFDADVVSERYAKDFEEKLTELIIQECVDVANDYVRGNHGGIQGSPTAKSMIGIEIQKHFGVEE